jgi:hypothetical protein
VREDLLQPSLDSAAAPAPLYSVRSAVFVSFFGGPLAAIAWSALNSARLRRLARDLPLHLALAAALVLALAWLANADSAAPARAALAERRTWNLVSRGLGLAVFGLLYLRHRAFHRSAALLSLPTPNPWLPGIACVLVGGILFNALRLWLAGELPR